MVDAVTSVLQSTTARPQQQPQSGASAQTDAAPSAGSPGSLSVYVDNERDVVLLQLKQNGEVVAQYPNKDQIAVIKQAQQRAEKAAQTTRGSAAPAAPAPEQAAPAPAPAENASGKTTTTSVLV